jgi:hypothetical protein
MPKFIDFEPFSEQLAKPELLISDFAKFDRPQQLHVGVQALHKFAEQNDGELPHPIAMMTQKRSSSLQKSWLDPATKRWSSMRS